MSLLAGWTCSAVKRSGMAVADHAGTARRRGWYRSRRRRLTPTRSATMGAAASIDPSGRLDRAAAETAVGRPIDDAAWAAAAAEDGTVSGAQLLEAVNAVPAASTGSKWHTVTRGTTVLMRWNAATGAVEHAPQPLAADAADDADAPAAEIVLSAADSTTGSAGPRMWRLLRDVSKAAGGRTVGGWQMYETEAAQEGSEAAASETYWYNDITGESTWEDPTPGRGADSEQHDTTFDPLDQDGNGIPDALEYDEDGNYIYGDQFDCPWGEVFSSEGAFMYYYNYQTGDYTIDKPAALDEDEKKKDDELEKIIKMQSDAMKQVMDLQASFMAQQHALMMSGASQPPPAVAVPAAVGEQPPQAAAAPTVAELKAAFNDDAATAEQRENLEKAAKQRALHDRLEKRRNALAARKEAKPAATAGMPTSGA